MHFSNDPSTRRRLTTAALLLASAALAASCSAPASAPAAPAPPVPAAAPLPPDADASEQAIRFLEDRVKSDPQDFIAYNKLVGYYMQRMRETGNLDYLNLASKAAHASLDSVPAEQNVGGLAALTQTEYASHEFAAARDHALRLRELDPGKLYPLHFLADALLELGDYDGAAGVFSEIQRRGGNMEGSLNAETRLARLALLRGKPDEAEQHFTIALAAARALDPVPRETVAWCYWQLGETAFSVGKYDVAEQRYRDALTTFPDYYRAVASLGRVLAAKGDLQSAIGQYEAVVRRLPDPTYVAALGDLYKIAGREKDAAAQYDLVEQIAHLSEVNGVLYNRNLALFYADHDMKPDLAYENARREYETRKDVYGADALAWAALKAGRVDEARTAIKEALRLGTRDAKLLYHAGMIARAAGDAATARENLRRALELSPQFDPLQAPVARQTLDSL
jgi:tetratricopeptide (TPR) repeat protein